MVIAVLVVIGVEIVVIVAFLASVVTRRRWVRRQPGVFRGAIRVAGGHVHGLKPRWSRGYGRWIRDVHGLDEFAVPVSTTFLPADSLGYQRETTPEELRRLGEHPTVVRMTSGDPSADIAADREHRKSLLGAIRGRR